MSSGETEFRAGMFVRGKYPHWEKHIFKLVKPIDSDIWFAKPISYEAKNYEAKNDEYKRDQGYVYIDNCTPVEDDFTLWVEDVRKDAGIKR